MKTKINYKALIPYFLCTMTYSFAAIMNAGLMEHVFVLKELSYNDLEKIYYYDILGYIFGAFALLICNNYFTLRKIVIFNLLIYILSVFALSFIALNPKLTAIYSMVYSGTDIIIVTILLCYIFNDKKIINIDALSLFFLSIVTAYFLVEFCLSHNPYQADLNLTRNLVILNIIPIAIFLFIFIFADNFNSSTQNKNTGSLSILKNIELELLSSFVIFYILMTIFWGYEVYALTDSLLMISVSDTKYYIFIAMLATSILAPRFIFKYNPHKINILSILCLLLLFLSMPFWGISFFLDSICWFLIGMILYMYFWSNLFILAEKFESANLQLTIILYTLAASIGYYCGYLTIEITEDTIGEKSFLISICFVLFVLLGYYLYLYKKNNLKEW